MASNNDPCINIDGEEYCRSENNNNIYDPPSMPPYVPQHNVPPHNVHLHTGPSYDPGNMDAPNEGFSIQEINMDNVLKAIFFGAIFYLLSLPDVYKITKKCCKSVDGVLLHSIVFAVVYFIVIHFI